MPGKDFKKDSIPEVIIERLPRYHRYLSTLVKNGVEKISSQELSKMMGITASQLRQDLSKFGSFGQQGYGYNVRELQRQVSKILGLEKEYKMVIIGVGSLGRALANYRNFGRRGFVLAGLFDVNRDVIGTEINGVSVLPMSELVTFLKSNDIHIGVITTPQETAQPIADQLVEGGVRGIWNFAPVDLIIPPEIIVVNEHIADGLFKLSYKLKQN